MAASTNTASNANSVVHDTTVIAAAGAETCATSRLEFTGNAYCGGHLNSVTNQAAGGSIITKDFKVRLTIIGAAGINSATGYKLNYKQTGCS